jgi:hypothetical protein
MKIRMVHGLGQPVALDVDDCDRSAGVAVHNVTREGLMSSYGGLYLACRYKSYRVGLTTICRAELTESAMLLTAANDLAIKGALEKAGMEFIDENGGGPGVRLRKTSIKTAE